MEVLKLSSLLIVIAGIIASLFAITTLKSISAKTAIFARSSGIIMIATFIATLGMGLFEIIHLSAGKRYVGRAHSASRLDVEAQPEIVITSAPSGIQGGPLQRIGTLAGTASDCQDCKVLVYARAVNGMWFAQTVDEHGTPLRPDGTWEQLVYAATEYAALLVKASYQPSPELATLPEPSTDILAISIVQGHKN